MKFIADVMLGSLAKWLRILGFDTLYFRDIGDNKLVKVAKQEGRILLTRDTGICRSGKTGECLLVQSQAVISQIREVFAALNIHADAKASYPRCVLCNGELMQVDRRMVSGDVPEHVLRGFAAFLKCGHCGKVYWSGTHRKMMDKIISAMTKDTEVC